MVFSRHLGDAALVRATRYGRHSSRTGHASPASLQRQCQYVAVIRHHDTSWLIEKLVRMPGFCRESAPAYRGSR
jgi:hypothetical protein